MARLDKLKAAFRSCDGPFPWRDFETMLSLMGYEAVKTGRSGGSRRRYFKPATGHMIFLHKPHGPQLAPGMVDRIRAELLARGEL